MPIEPECPGAIPEPGGETQDAGSGPCELVAALRELGRLLPGHLEIDWEEDRNRVRDIFRAMAGGAIQRERTGRLTALLQGAQYILGGDEHDILRLEFDASRVYKLTRGNIFGCRSYFSPVDPDLIGHFHGEGNADPFFYLRRWQLLNEVSEFQTRLEGIVAPARPGWLPRFCISQPVLPGQNPSLRVLRGSFVAHGFVEISEGAYFDPTRDLLFTDASPRNVRVYENVPVPFDVIAQTVSGRLRDWCHCRATGGM